MLSSSSVAKRDENKEDVSILIKLKDSWGPVAQAGIDIILSDTWFLNLDVKYIYMNTQAKFRNIIQGKSASIIPNINPFVFGIGIGHPF